MSIFDSVSNLVSQASGTGDHAAVAGGLMQELERRLRVSEPVIKFLTVRVDEEQKRLDKIKQIRESRKKAAPAPAVPAEAASGESAPATA